MATRALLIALALSATTFLAPSATAAATNPEFTTDSPDVRIEIGQVLPVGFTLHAGTAADGSSVCTATPATPTRLSFSPPTSVQVFPAPIFFTACGSTKYVDLRVNDVLDGTMTISASDGLGTSYTTIHGSAHVVSGIWGQFTPPVIDAPPSITTEATSPLGAPVVTAFSATDPNNVASFDCSPTLTVFPVGRTPVTCIALDSYGNRAEATTNVTVVDTTPPRVQVPPDIAVTTAFVTYPTSTKFVAGGGLFARDLVSLTVPVACAPPSGARFPAGATVVRCTATDAHGNVGYGNFTVTVNDITKPSIRISPSTATYEATSPAGAVATFAPVVTDDIDLAPTYVCAPASGSTFPLGTTSVPCTARDGTGNSASASMTVIVVDTTPPAITVPPDLAAEAWTAAGAPVSYVASALDVVDLAVAPTCLPASESLFPMGVTTVTCTATDAHGNVGSRTFTIRILDSSPPSIGPLSDVILEATGPAGAAVSWPTVTGNDAVGGILPATCTPAPGTFAIGSAVVTCAATDPAGNSASARFTVVVRDTTPPAITVPDVVEARPWGPDAIVSWPSSATDVVDDTDPVVCAPASGSTFPAGDTTVTCASTDAHGNAISTTLVVRVDPIPPPTLAPLSDITVEATGPAGAAVSWPAVYGADGLGQLLGAACAPAAGTFPLGATTVTCAVTDAGGRAASVAFRVIVRDTTPPVISAPASVSATTYGPTAVVTFPATASDLVDGADAVACAPASGSAFAVGDTPVVCTSTDAHGNAASTAFVVHVTHATPPTIGAPPDQTLEATGPSGASATWTTPGATDWQGHALLVSCTPTPGTFALGATAVTCKATDANGVSSSATFTIDVRDTTPPTISAPAAASATTYGASAIVNFSASATDVVDGSDAVTCAPASGSAFAVGDTVVGCASTDKAGNKATKTFTVHVIQASAPTVGPLADLAYVATGPNGAAASWPTVAGQDWLGNALPATCAPAPGTFALGTTTVTCVVTDAAGVKGTTSFEVVVKDTTPPKIAAPASFSAAGSNATGGPVSWNASATDVVDGTDAVACAPASGSFFPVGATIVKCTSTDKAGNLATVAFTVTVTANAPPPACNAGVGSGSERSAGSDGREGDRAYATYGSDAWRSSSDRHHEDDDENGHGSGSGGSSCAPLSIASLPPQTLGATSASGAIASWPAPKTTGGSGAVTVTCAPASGSTFAIGATSVTCTARDALGATAKTSFTITVAPACSSARSDDDRFSPGHESDAFRYAQGLGFSGRFQFDCYGKTAKTPKLYYSEWKGGSEKPLPTRTGSNDCAPNGGKWKYDVDGKTLPKGDYKVRIDSDGQTLGYAHVIVA